MDSQDEPALQKGKGKEKETNTGEKPVREGDLAAGQGQRSLLSRVAGSASAMSNALLTGPARPDILSRTAMGEKGSSSTPSSGKSFEALGNVAQYHAPGAPSSSQAQTFRSNDASQHAASAEAAFAEFLDDTDVSTSLHHDAAVPNGLRHSDDPMRQPAAGYEQTPERYRSVTEQELHDGEDVIALLDEGQEELPEADTDEALSPEESDSLRRALFGSGEATTRPTAEWDQLLNFIPAYLRVGESSRYQADAPSNSQRAADTALHLGVSDTDQAWQTWIDQWSDVLTRYTDEVWGDLSSLVAEAREEVKQLEETGLEDLTNLPPALRRLRAILGHLRGHI